MKIGDILILRNGSMVFYLGDIVVKDNMIKFAVESETTSEDGFIYYTPSFKVVYNMGKL